jgi:hypothetical protein
MRQSFAAAMLAAILGVLSQPLFAQWPAHPLPGVPKGPDGKPNLNAPAPRSADGKPDLSGTWVRSSGPEFKDGLPFQPWAADLQKLRASQQGLNDPDGLCLPQGPLQYHIDPQPFKIVETPREILYVSESNYGLREIYMDGRSLPKPGSVQPYWNGYSIGRWDGDTLVVESNNFHGVDPNNPQAVGLPDSYLGAGWLDHRGSPYTEAMKLTEAFRRVNYGTLEINLIVDDPKAYTKPFSVRVVAQVVADGTEPIEFICHENQTFLKLTGRALK